MSKSNNSGGMGFFSILTLIFIVLKLTDVIDWSWWYVLMPFYGSIIFGLLILILALMVGSNKSPRKPRW